MKWQLYVLKKKLEKSGKFLKSQNVSVNLHTLPASHKALIHSQMHGVILCVVLSCFCGSVCTGIIFTMLSSECGTLKKCKGENVSIFSKTRPLTHVNVAVQPPCRRHYAALPLAGFSQTNNPSTSVTNI